MRRNRVIIMSVLLSILCILTSCSNTNSEQDISGFMDPLISANAALDPAGESDEELYTYVASYQELRKLPGAVRTDFQIVQDSLFMGLVIRPGVESSKRYRIYQKPLLTDEEVAEIQPSLLSDEEIWCFTVTEEGQLYLLTSVPDENQRAEFYICQCDIDGNVLLRTKFSDQITNDIFDFQFMSTDSTNRIYITTTNRVLLFTAEGTFEGEVAIQEYISAIGQGADGNVYIQYSENNNTMVGRIDYEKQSNSAPFVGISSIYTHIISPGLTGELLMNSGTVLYDYTVESDTKQKIITWSDSGIIGADVMFCAPLSDQHIAAVLSRTRGEEEQFEVALLEKKPKTQVPEREELVLASLTPDMLLDEAVAEFNSKNTQYCITVKTYLENAVNNIEDLTAALFQMQMDFTTSDEVDLYNLRTITDVAAYSYAGAFEDLTPYLEASETLHKEDFIPAALQGRTFGERLVSIPTQFSLQFLVVQKEILGDKTTISAGDLLELIQKYPDTKLFPYPDKMNLFVELFSVYGEEFIDWEAGECHFESEEFWDFLKLIKAYPDGGTWEEYDAAMDDFRNNRLLFTYASFYSVIWYKTLMDQVDGMDVSFIGKPSKANTSGIQMNIFGGDVAIAARSKHKEGAWAFIEAINNNVTGDMFPTNIQSLEEIFAAELAGTAYVDPAIAEWNSVRPTTQEDVDAIKQLIETAKVAEMNYGTGQALLQIIGEEIQVYLTQGKTEEETAANIQNRAQILVSEMS